MADAGIASLNLQGLPGLTVIYHDDAHANPNYGTWLIVSYLQRDVGNRWASSKDDSSSLWHRMRHVVASRNVKVTVLAPDDSLVAYAVIGNTVRRGTSKLKDDVWEVMLVETVPKYRRMGVGYSLMLELERYVRSTRKARHMWAYTLFADYAGFWSKLGYSSSKDESELEDGLFYKDLSLFYDDKD